MLADLPGERGGSDIDIRWGDTRDCHFPLFNFLQPLKFPYMCLLYAAMTTGTTVHAEIYGPCEYFNYQCVFNVIE